MAWDEKKNKVIAEKKLVDGDSRVIFVQVTSYNGGPVRLSSYQITTDKKGKEWTSHVKPMDPPLAKKFAIAMKKFAIELLENTVD
jgi:hypothetical protein